MGRTWGNHTFQHLEKDDQLVDLLHMPKSKPAFIKKPGQGRIKATAGGVCPIGFSWRMIQFELGERESLIRETEAMVPSAFSGNSARVETEDMLSRFRRPQQGPEPDLDSLYHPASQEIQVKEEPLLRAMLSRQVLRGPEKDLDHIYHPTGES